MKYDIFISYRRSKTADKAEHMLSLLSNAGYKGKVSFDKDNFSGRFDLEILKRVDNCKDFIIILGKDTFSYLKKEDADSEIIRQVAMCAPEEFPSFEPRIGRIDFVRIELARAIRKGKNIIPVVPADTPDYSFSSLELPPDIASLVKYQAVYYSDNDNCFLFQDVLPKVTAKLVTKPGRSISAGKSSGLPVYLALIAGVAALAFMLVSDVVAFRSSHTLSQLEQYSQKQSFPTLFKDKASARIEQIGDIEKSLQALDGFGKARFSGDITLEQASAILKIASKMIRVTGGSFTTGAASESAGIKERPAHPETALDCMLGKYEVSEDEWFGIMGEGNPVTDYPVTGINWHQAMSFCSELERLCGIAFTLPYEREWEYASGYGDNTVYAGSNNPEAVAWFKENSGGQPHQRRDRKGNLKCNYLEFYDMSGNVAEWCADAFALYGQEPESQDVKVIRGGSAADPVKKITITYRDPMDAGSSSPYVGFRLAVYL